MTTAKEIAEIAEINSPGPAETNVAIDTGVAPIQQETGFDVVALLVIALVVVTFHILAPGLRDDSPTGQAFKVASLRQIITMILGFLVIALAVGESNRAERLKAFSIPLVRWLATGIVGFYAIYIVLLIASGLVALLTAILPLFTVLATLASVIVFALLLFITMIAGDQEQALPRQMSVDTFVHRVACTLLGLYVLYVVSFVFFGLEFATDSILPTLAEIAALLGVIALWRPWNRLVLYRRQLPRLLPPLLLFVGILGILEVMIKVFQVEQFLLPAPSVVIGTFVANYSRLVNQGWFTFQNALWGYGIGCGTGILFGLISARYASFSKAMLPYAIAANSIPIVAFAPITNAWFGSGAPISKITIVAVLTFFPAMINTVRGLTSADPASLELMRSLAAREVDIFRKLRLPVALPYIFTGLKLAASLSMIGAIVAEYFGGALAWLGVQISTNAPLLRFPLVWSEIIIASLLGIIFYFVVSLAERLIMPWHVSFRQHTE